MDHLQLNQEALCNPEMPVSIQNVILTLEFNLRNVWRQ